MHYPKKISICEVGPRDGLQNENVILTVSDKIELIELAIKAGYSVIEVGSMVHPKAIPSLADTEDVFKGVNKPSHVEFRVLVTNLKGVQRAIDSGINKVKLTVSASESHNISNFNRKTSETLDAFEPCVELAMINNVDISAAISTAFGCPFEGAVSIEKIEGIVERLLCLGIKEISLSDTTGMGNPKEVNEKCLYFYKKYPEVKWNLHFHNTRDMGLANVLAAMDAGITNFDASFSGIGGCPYAPGASGNLCSEDLVHMCENMGIETGINLDLAIELAKLVVLKVNHSTESYMIRAGKISELTSKALEVQKNN